MTTNVPAYEVHAGEHGGAKPNFLNVTKGFMSWAATLDHKRIGIMYLIGVTAAFLAGGLFALLVRLHLWEPTGALFDNATYNQIFTLHGAFMVFIFVIPAIPGSLGNIVLPIMLGAKDVALPRLNLLSFYLWLTGTGFALYAILALGAALVDSAQQLVGAGGVARVRGRRVGVHGVAVAVRRRQRALLHHVRAAHELAAEQPALAVRAPQRQRQPAPRRRPQIFADAGVGGRRIRRRRRGC